MYLPLVVRQGVEAGLAWVQGAAAVELVPWPHADQAHEWAQSIQTDFGLPIQVSWTRLGDVSNLHYHTEVRLAGVATALCIVDSLLHLNLRRRHAVGFTAKQLVCLSSLQFALYTSLMGLQVLFKEPLWQTLNVTQRLGFLENGTCPGVPFSPLNLACRNEWMHYLVSFVQPWEPLEDLLNTLHAFVQTHAIGVAAD